MKGRQWDYVFLLSNEPVPGLVEKVRLVAATGRHVVLIYLSRPWTALVMEDLPGVAVVRVPVHFHEAGVRRAAEFFMIAHAVKRIFAAATRACDVYVDSVDLLAIAVLLGAGGARRYRFEVRDLHRLQLGRGLAARAVQLCERVLLRWVDVLVLTSRAHFERYYRARYRGVTVYIENIPPSRSWLGFVRRPQGRFIVGFIGVLRYRRCLEALIDAVKLVNVQGLPVFLRLAGGGIVDELRTYAGEAPFIEFTGPFVYSSSASGLYRDLSLIHAAYDADDANVRLAVANKFYEAQLARIPILVARGTYLADLVRKQQIGDEVPHADAIAIAGKLTEAFKGASWYREAEENLATVDANALFAQHESELYAAVFG